jgi:hypothetical protein
MTFPQPGPPHPSVAIPQLNPWFAHVSGSHRGASQTLGGPAPPQVWHGGQLPQSIAVPHPSVAVPQLRPCSAQVRATQPLLEELVALVEAPPVEDDPDELVAALDNDDDDPLLEGLVVLVVEVPP